MFSNIEWLFFDIGSTIIDERLAYQHRLQELAECANVSYQEVQTQALSFYRQNKKGDSKTAKLYSVPVPTWHPEDEILFPDAVECLKTLSLTYKMGIFANQSLGTQNRLREHGILEYFSLIIASAEEGVSKPDPRIFELALAKSGCSLNHGIMIGDRIDNDIVPANLLGMHTIWIKQGFGQYWQITRDVEQADYVVSSLGELCGIL